MSTAVKDDPDPPDGGHGVAPADRDRVFGRLVRRAEGGAGLGAAITRDAVRYHGGTLTLTDAPGGGALFPVRLPRAR